MYSLLHNCIIRSSNVLVFIFSWQDHKCPEGLVKCKDNLQCISKVAMCQEGHYLGPDNEGCKDGSHRDPDICKGKIYTLDVFCLWFVPLFVLFGF